MNQDNQINQSSKAVGELGSPVGFGILRYIDLKRNLRAIGPGLLMAGAAVGTSHLVQSTRAGADFGYQLLVLLVVVNILKYPFFEYGHRYAAATGENLLDGYNKMGRGYVYAFLVLAVISGIGSTAAVTFLTVLLVQYFAGTGIPAAVWSVVIMALAAALLLGNHYRRLDSAMKPLMAVLAVGTVLAFLAAFLKGSVASPDFVSPSPWTTASIVFLVALMGWMPVPIEVSVFQSLWMQARDSARGRRTTLSEAQFDFNFGYLLTVGLALIFLGLGALVLHGSGIQLANASGAFITQLIGIFQQALGSWAGPVIAVAAFATMFSTTFTVIDGYSRALDVGVKLVAPAAVRFTRLYTAWMALICVSAFIVILAFIDSLTALIDVVTIAAFLAAPVYGYLNYRLITSRHTPVAVQPGLGMRILSWLGLAFFVLVGGAFVVLRLSGASI